MINNTDLKILLFHEGANYLRDWLKVTQITIQDIILSMEKVISLRSTADKIDDSERIWKYC